MIIKHETREKCQCPCKDKGKSSDSSSTISGASVILVDSAIPTKTFNNPTNNQNTINYTASSCFSYPQQQTNQINYSPGDQSMVSPLMTQSNLDIAGTDQSNLPVANLNNICPPDYQFNISSGSSSISSDGISYSSGIGSLGSSIDSMEPLFTTLSPSEDITLPTSCCENDSILQCVTLGCNSHRLEPKP